MVPRRTRGWGRCWGQFWCGTSFSLCLWEGRTCPPQRKSQHACLTKTALRLPATSALQVSTAIQSHTLKSLHLLLSRCIFSVALKWEQLHKPNFISKSIQRAAELEVLKVSAWGHYLTCTLLWYTHTQTHTHTHAHTDAHTHKPNFCVSNMNAWLREGY